MPRLSFVLSLLLTGLLCQSVAGDEPKKVEPIPAPKKQIEPPSITIVPYTPRADTLEVWQHYGVNRQGRFVPRVIVLPFGAYYTRNLEPYPWIGSRGRDVLPLKVD